MRKTKLVTRGMIFLIVSLTVYVLLLGDYSIFKVGSLFFEKEELKKKLVGLEKERQQLIEEQKEIEEDSFALEKLAREKLGMVKQGEKLLKAVVVDSQPGGGGDRGDSSDGARTHSREE